MRIAVISDIHGNLEALKTTLEDISRRNIDKIICIGDTIAKGVHSKECLDLVRENCDVILRGNCDRHFTDEKNINLPRTKEQAERYNWVRQSLSEEDRKYLFKLPFCYEFYMSGSLVRMFHARPDVDNQPVIDMDDIETKYKMFLPTEKTNSQEIADVVIYGHIHDQFMSRLYNKTLINVGSVGNSFNAIRNDKKDSNLLETTRICYMVMEGEYGSKEYTSEISFQFIKIPYNMKKELEDSDLNIEVDKETYINELTEGRYRNMAKINANYERLGVDINKI